MIRGWQKISLIDYPGKISTILFFSGCNFRCGFCHNPDLVFNRGLLPKYTEEEILNYLNKRKPILEAVVLTGGEPIFYRNLVNFLKKIKALSLLIKIDTNGTNPDLLEELIADNLIDYVAMDLKGPLNKYQQITGNDLEPALIKKSLHLIMKSQLPYEFRSTIVPYFHESDDIKEMARLIKGAELYCLQKFVPRKNLVDLKLINTKGYSTKEMENFAKICSQFVKKCIIR
jgi:pyruvate formate lyase activating enzyme